MEYRPLQLSIAATFQNADLSDLQLFWVDHVRNSQNSSQSPIMILCHYQGTMIGKHLAMKGRSLHPVMSRTFSYAGANSLPWKANVFNRMFQAYAKALDKKPLLTKATMAAGIFFCSDTATQYILRDKRKEFVWDPARALSGSVFGVVATAWLHFWWNFLEAAVGARLPIGRHRLANTLSKVALDQGIGAPLYIYSYYVLTNFGQVLFGGRNADVLKSWKETNERAGGMLWPTMLQHWKLWPAVHSFNFYFVPLHHRVLCQNLVLVGWSGYLSHLNNGGLMTPDEEINATIVRRETERRLTAEEARIG